MAPPEITITYECKTLTLREWSVERCIPYDTLYWRYCRNLPIAEVLCSVRLNPRRRRTPAWTLAASRRSTGHHRFMRMKAGLPPEDVLKRGPSKPATPFTLQSRLTFMGETMTVAEWSLDLGLSVSRVLSGLNAGESVEASLAKDPLPKAMGPKPRLARPVAAMRVPTLAELREMRQAA